MAKNYGRKRVKQQRSLMSQILLVGISLIFGYFVASFYNMSQLKEFVMTQWLINKVTPAVQHQNIATSAKPKPNFEFYTLLTKEPDHRLSEITGAPAMSESATVKSNATVATSSITPQATVTLPPPKLTAAEPTATPSSVRYIVQLASFKSRLDAERMKAKLIMKGFDVLVVTAPIQQGSWFRVMMGPFATKSQAESAQMTFLAREHVKGMVRRMDA